MSGWVAYGIEKCEQCGEFSTWNHQYFPAIQNGGRICRICLEKNLEKSKNNKRTEKISNYSIGTQI